MLVRHEMGAHEEYAEFRSAAEIGARLQLPEMCPDLAEVAREEILLLGRSRIPAESRETIGRILHAWRIATILRRTGVSQAPSRAGHWLEHQLEAVVCVTDVVVRL